MATTLAVFWISTLHCLVIQNKTEVPKVYVI